MPFFEKKNLPYFAAIIIVILAGILLFLHYFKPVREIPLEQPEGVTEQLDSSHVLVQSFHIDRRMSTVSFIIATYCETIEAGQMTVSITDEKTGSLVSQTVFEAPELIDNAVLTIQTDLPQGDYQIEFRADDIKGGPIVLYTSSGLLKGACYLGGGERDYSVYLEFVEAVDPAVERERTLKRFTSISALVIIPVVISLFIPFIPLRGRKPSLGNPRKVFFRSTAAGICLLLAAWFLFSSFQETVMNGSTAFLRSDRVLFYCILVLFSLFFCFSSDRNAFTPYLFVMAVGLVLIFVDTHLSIIDEGAHTEIVQFIRDQKAFPTVYDNYEAVQGPLFYYVLFLLGGWLPDSYIYLAGRLFGFFCLICFGVITKKTLRVLSDYEIVRITENLQNLLWLCFVANPQIIIRFTRVSNEAMMCVLIAVAIHLFVCEVLQGFSKSKIYLATILCALAFLTKSTCVFVFGLVFIVCAYYRQWMLFLKQILVYCLFVVPWFYSNYRIYGALTGMQGHLDFVLPIVNPNMNKPDIWFDLIHFFERYFVNPECGIWYDYPVLDHFINPLLLIFLTVALVFSLQFLFRAIKSKLSFNYALEEKKKVLFLSFTALPVVSFIMHAVQSLMSYNDTACVNRYYLMLNGALCGLILIAASSLSEKTKKAASGVLCVFYAFFIMSLICGYTETILAY